MAITDTFENGVLEIFIDGELDVNLAIDLDETIKKAYSDKRYKVCINCEKLEYISSAGLGVFISHLENFTARKGKFVFYNMKDKVYSVFQILGLHNLMSIVGDKKKALELIDES